MSWPDRITQLVYTSPSGREFIGIFEDVSKVISKKTTEFIFPDVGGTYVQDLGKNGRKYPIRWIFSGEDYDLVAELFDTALEEKGPGVLQHPLYGTFDVIPFGDITRSDNLVSGANQAIYDITFYEVIKIIYPISDLSAKNKMNELFDTYSENVVANYNASLNVTSAQETTGYIASARAGLNKIKKSIASIASTTESISRDFNNIADILDDTITTLVGGPTLIAAQMIELTRLPSQTASSIQAKLDAYSNLINEMILGNSNQFTMGLDSQAGNSFSNNSLIATNALIAAIESTISDEIVFKTRSDVIAAIEKLESLFEALIAWMDENRETLVQQVLPRRAAGTNDLIDTGEAYQNLLEVYSIAQGRLTQIAFTALQERTVILDRDRTFIDFCAQYYQTLDDRYDFVIQSNNLVGSELFELKKGRSMVYYV